MKEVSGGGPWRADLSRPWFKFSKTPAFDFGHLTEFSIFLLCNFCVKSRSPNEANYVGEDFVEEFILSCHFQICKELLCGMKTDEVANFFLRTNS